MPARVPRRQLAPALGDTRLDRHAGLATVAPLQPAPGAGGGPGRVRRVGHAGPLLRPPNLACSREAVLVGPAAAATFREADPGRRPAASGGPPRTGSPRQPPASLLSLPCSFPQPFLRKSSSQKTFSLRFPSPSFSFLSPTAFYPGAAWLRRALGAGPLSAREAWRPEPGVPEASAQRLERWPAALAPACLIPLPGPSPPHPSQRLGWRLGMDLERGARWWW